MRGRIELDLHLVHFLHRFDSHWCPIVLLLPHPHLLLLLLLVNRRRVFVGSCTTVVSVVAIKHWLLRHHLVMSFFHHARVTETVSLELVQVYLGTRWGFILGHHVWSLDR